MLMHLTYFLAHALCERFPTNDNDMQPPVWLPRNTAALETAPSQSIPLTNQGRSRTHAKTESQAMIRGPVGATITVRVADMAL
jgi:hypothetical protein